MRQIFVSHRFAAVKGNDFHCGDGQRITRPVQRVKALPTTYELRRKKHNYSGIL
jgi:hypothetical protein